MERKKFILFLGASVATGSLISFIESCKKDSSASSAPTVDFTLDLTATANAALVNSGGSLVHENVIIINNNGSYVALSDICTHQGCSLNFSSSSNQIQCHCHGGVFNLNGAVVSGPPPSGLKQYSVSKSGSSLHVSG